MATEYYAICEEHGVVVNVSDNKGNPPAYPEKFTNFMLEHATCKKLLVSDSEIDISSVLPNKITLWKLREPEAPKE